MAKCSFKLLSLSIALGFVIGFIGGILHFDPRFLSRLSILAGIVTSVVVGIWAVKHVLAGRFKDFRIVLLPLD